MSQALKIGAGVALATFLEPHIRVLVAGVVPMAPGPVMVYAGEQPVDSLPMGIPNRSGCGCEAIGAHMEDPTVRALSAGVSVGLVYLLGQVL